MMISCDPGGEHVGLAGWKLSGRPSHGGWGTCMWTMEMAPADAIELICTGVELGTTTILVVESWRLFADKAAKLVGSDMPTSRLIGAIEFMVAKFGGSTTKLVFQDPVIKKPTRSLADLRGYRMRSSTKDKSGGHASDAELHGLCWLDRHGYGWGDWSKEY